MFSKVLYPIGPDKVNVGVLIFGGIFSSFSRAFYMFTIAMCILSCAECRENNDKKHCDKITIYGYIFQMIPYLFRATHSLNIVYYKKSLWPHFVNAMRFFTTCVSLTMSYLYSQDILSIYFYIPFGIISFCFNIWYDFFVSWNLLQLKSKNFLLRDKIVYPKWFYYFAIVSNIILRAAWTLRFILVMITKDFLFFILIILEVFRRTQFILIRIDNEFFNNPEKFKKFMPVPELLDDKEIGNKVDQNRKEIVNNYDEEECKNIVNKDEIKTCVDCNTDNNL